VTHLSLYFHPPDSVTSKLFCAENYIIEFPGPGTLDINLSQPSPLIAELLYWPARLHRMDTVPAFVDWRAGTATPLR
jgi:hypothetical protein